MTYRAKQFVDAGKHFPLYPLCGDCFVSIYYSFFCLIVESRRIGIVLIS